MFTNLIESHSHRQEFKRRSSFFLATVAGYSLIIFAALVVGVLTYDARVEAQNTDLMVDLWIPPVKPAVDPEGPQPTRPIRKPTQPNAPVDRNIRVAERTQPITMASDPTKVPDKIGTTGSESPPAAGPVVQSTRNADPPANSEGNEGRCENCTGTETGPVNTTPPTVVEPVKQPPKTIISTIIASTAVSLPKPVYPIIAKQAGAQGPVNVQILIDVDGRVISAQAVKGNPMLTRAAEDAAKRARFTPTVLNNQQVKVQGVITYNFSLH